MPNIKTLENIDLKNKRALVRVDFDLPLDDKGNITDDFRLKECLPTIKYLISQKCSIVLISHLNRPKGKRIKKYSLKPITKKLEKLLRQDIIFYDKTISEVAINLSRKMRPGSIMLLENLRFNPGEEKNLPEFSRKLSEFGDIFINEAFAVSHREHASIVGIPEYLPSFLGFRFRKEVKELDKILYNPERPLVAIIGGAKISTKIKVINKFLKIADKVLMGGALANTVFAGQGFNMGSSIIDKGAFTEVEKIIPKKRINPKLFLPIDLGIWDGKIARYDEVNGVKEGEKALDCGPKTINLFSRIIEEAKTIVWNGPLGLTEQKPFEKASGAMVEVIRKSSAYSVVGGGDTVGFIRKIKKEKAFNHLSTGGGAMLDYLANETLPGLEAIGKCQKFGN